MKRFHQLDGLELWSALPSMERILGFDGSLKKKQRTRCMRMVWTYACIFLQECASTDPLVLLEKKSREK